MSACEPVRPRLEEFAANALDVDLRREVEQHVRGCASCLRELDAVRAVEESLRSREEDGPTPEELAAGLDRVRARLDRRNLWKGVIPMTAAAAVIAAIVAWTMTSPQMMTPPPDQPAQPKDEIQELIAQLDSENPEERSSAEDKLVALGAKAEPALRNAMTSEVPEVAARAQSALAKIAAERGVIVNIAHQDPAGAKCEEHQKGKPCREEAHWAWTVEGKICDKAELKELIDKRAAPTRKAVVSELRAWIRGEPMSPYSLAQNAMNICARCGVYKVEIGLARNDGTAESFLKTWLPRDTEGPIKEPPAEVRAFLQYSPDGTLERRVDGTLCGDDKGLLGTIESSLANHKKAGKELIILLVDAAPEVPFDSVVRLVELCPEEILRVEFAAPKPGR